MSSLSPAAESAAGKPRTAMPAAAWAATFAGLAASLVGIGLSRFAYTPLIPPLIAAHWFSASDVVYLGAANLAGYLAGALTGRPIARSLGNTGTLKLMMLVVTLAFFACAVPLSVTWFFVWRFASGLGGGAIMVLVAATVLPHVPASRRGFSSGAIFMGAGVGVAASGTLIPALIGLGLAATWIGLGIASAVLTVAAWFCWPRHNPHLAGPFAAEASREHGASHQNRSLTLTALYGQYALNAAGLVPMIVFLVDFIERGLGQSATVGAFFWVLYGLGAIIGPIATGMVTDRFGSTTSLRLSLLVQALFLAIPALTTNLPAIAVASFVMGALTPGIVPVALARIHDLLPGDHAAQGVAWSRATTGFALMQAASAYFYSWLFTATGGSHAAIYACGVVAMVLTLALDLFAWLMEGRRRKI
jgi:predicted MFS family arabinose efflux permease